MRSSAVNIFRVLILDDNEEFLKRLLGRMTIADRTYEGQQWRIQIVPVKVEIENGSDGTARIAETTISALADACASPPHIICVDYGYGRSEYEEKAKAVFRERQTFTHEEKRWFSSFPALVEVVRDYVASPSLDKTKRKTLDRNFLHTRAKILLYSFASPVAVAASGTLNERLNLTQSAFPHTIVATTIDSRYEFFNGDEWDPPPRLGQEKLAQSKYESAFYAHLMGGWLNQVIQREFVEHILEDAKHLKFFRLPKTRKAMALIVLLGASVGAVGELLGSLTTNSAMHGEFLVPVIIVVLGIVFILVGSWAVHIFVARVLADLFEHEEDDRA